MTRLLFAFALAISLLTPSARAGFFDFLLKRDVQVIAVTDMTPEGALIRHPTPENPQYYMAISAGYREFGGIIAGEKSPPSKEVIQLMTTVLAKQGYKLATNKNPPQLIIVYTWGTLNPDPFITPYTEPHLAPVMNMQQMLKFLGAYKVRGLADYVNPDIPKVAGLSYLDPDARDLYDIAHEDLYIIALSAYDFASAARSKDKRLLWRTKISAPSRGLWLPEVLPTMLSIAAPHIGRETTKPVWINASDRYKPDIRIGEPRVVEENSPDVVVEAEPSKKGPASLLKNTPKKRP